MMTPAEIPWQSWAPPLDPPVSGGLPQAAGQQIADTLWDDDPHCAAAEMWEAYAAMLPPGPPVAAVTTGAQSVTYSPAGPLGDYGSALARAQWHRSFCDGQLQSVPLVATIPPQEALPDPAWWLVGPPGPAGPPGPPGPGNLAGIKGSLDSPAQLPAAGEYDGEAWIVGPLGELWVWKHDGGWRRVS